MFSALSVEDQCKVIQQILLAFAANTNPIDLSNLHQSKKAAVICISKKISNLEECILINQSVTGLYEQTIDFLSL